MLTIQYTVYMLHKYILVRVHCNILLNFHTACLCSNRDYEFNHQPDASPGLAAAVTPNVGFLSLTLTDQQGSSAFWEVQHVILVDNLRQEVAVGCDRVYACIHIIFLDMFAFLYTEIEAVNR